VIHHFRLLVFLLPSFYFLIHWNINMGSCLSRLSPGWPSRPRPSSTVSAECLNPSPQPVQQSFDGLEASPNTPTNAGKDHGEMVATLSGHPDQKKTQDFINAVYYPNWRVYNGQTPASLNLDSVSHLFYAFAK
jgi:hypothetical protein